MDNIVQYVLVCLILYVIERTYFFFAVRFRIVDIPHHQSSHKGAIIRGGGIIFYFAYLLWSLMNGFNWYGGLIGLSLLALVSFIDDIKDVDPKVRLICHFVAIILLFYHSGLIKAPMHVIFILVIACVGGLNIFNFMDGINGMTGGYSMVVLLALLYVDMNRVFFCDRNLIIYLLFALLVFNYYNFRIKAKCFAGDVGSLAIGFLIVYLILRLSIKGHSMSWIVMIAVYFVDGVMTMIHRLLLGDNLMKPHKKHAYQIMANELKIPHLVVAGIYMSLQAVSSFVYLIYPTYSTCSVILLILCSLYMFFMKKYYYLHSLK